MENNDKNQKNIIINNNIKHIRKLVFDYQAGRHGTQIKLTGSDSGNTEGDKVTKRAKTLRNWLLGIISTLIIALATICFEYWKFIHGARC